MAARSLEGKGALGHRGLSFHPSFGIAAGRMPGAREVDTFPELRVRPHPVFFAGTAGWVLFVGVVVALLIRNNDLPASTDWRIVGWGVLAALSGVVGPVVRWLRTSIELDATRLRYVTGVLRRSGLEVELDRAREVALEQSVLGRWFGYGRLRIVDAGGMMHRLPPVGSIGVFARAVSRRERRGVGRRG